MINSEDSDAILKNVFDSLNTPIFSIDINYVYTSFNSAYSKTMKALYNTDIELGKNCLDYYTNQNDRERLKEFYDRSIKGESFTVESWLGDNNYSRLYFEISQSPIRRNNREIIGVSTIAKNSTDRKHVEESLQNSRTDLEERIKERTSDLQISNDFLTNEIDARKKSEYQLAEKLKELQCLYDVTNLDNESDLKLEELLKRVVLLIPKGYRYSDSICVQITIDGETFKSPNWRETLKKQVADIKSETSIIGRIEVGFIIPENKLKTDVLFKDERLMLDAIGELLGSIIQRRRIKEQLFNSRERLSMAIQISSAGIYEFSDCPRSYYSNNRFAEILGYDLEELPNADNFMAWFFGRVYPEDRDLVRKSFDFNHLISNPKSDIQFRIIHKSGTLKYVRCISMMIISESGSNISNQINGIMLDITESKQTERSILLNNEIMKLFWESSNTKDYLSKIINLLHVWCHCDCIGIRLVDSETATIPYVAYQGFNDDFILSEGILSIERDQCACIRVISNKPEPQESQMLTPSGSLYLGNSFQYFDNLDNSQKLKYRGKCIQCGYRTIAIIPIKHRQTMFGVIHVTDKNVFALSGKEIETLEHAATLIGQGLYRFDIEDRIKTSQTRLNNAQKIAHLGNWEWNLQDNSLIWSDEVYSIFGKHPGAFKPTYQKFLSFVHPDDRDMVEKSVDAALYHQKPYNIEHRIILSDGTIGYVHVQGIVSHDELDQPSRMTGTIQDITSRKLMEKQLQESSLYARTLLEASLDPMVTINSDGKIMDVNEATEKSTGLSRNQLIGTEFADYFTDPANAREGYKRVFVEGYVRDYPLLLRNVDGSTLNVLYNATIYRNSVGEVQGVFAAARDITQLKKIEEELHALSKQIVNAQENERRFIARELHDEIGQSLTALKILISQVERQPENMRQNSLKDAHALVSELLQQVREMSLNLRPSMLDDLGLLPALIWHFDRFTTQTGIRINFEHEGIPRVLPSEINTTVYRIVQEALTNVVRYAEVNEARVNLVFNNGKLLITIEDKGKGFLLSDINTKATSGLSGMRERVLLLNGKITLDTAPQKGTRILVELPVNMQE